MNTRNIAAVLGAAALVLPAAAVADPGHGHGRDKKPATEVVKGKSKPKKAKTVTFVFKGTFTAPGTVEIVAGNAHVRKGGYVGQSVSFDLATARIVGIDTNADQKVDVADVADGDNVLVQARVTKGTKYVAPAEGETAEAIVARKLIDKTSSATEDAE
jgi:carbohydrate-selective porin OprB